MRGDQRQQLAQYFRCRSHDVAAFEPAVFAVHIGHDTASFLHNQATCRDVPRLQVEFEETIYAAAGHVAQIQCGRAFTACTGGFADHVFQDGQMGVQHALVYYRETGGDQAFVHVDAFGNANTAVVQERAHATAGGEHVVTVRVVNHRLLDLAAVCQRDGNAVLRVAVNEVGGAIDRVDDPLVLGGAQTAAAGLFC